VNTGGDADPNDGDQDGYPDDSDNCPEVANPDQADHDHDGKGDACDTDGDNDGFPDESDNCPEVANPDQADHDHDQLGDLCDNDLDGDGFDNDDDNCPNVANPSQADLDDDGIGDLCDGDKDGDGHDNGDDNCPNQANPSQEDSDNDGIGDACETIIDADSDGIPDSTDNCPHDANAEQIDSDLDGLGDACDPPTLHKTGLAFDDNCRFEPPVSVFEPTERWRWPLESDTISFPTKVQVMSTPVVANLTDDDENGQINERDIPEIVFISFDTSVPAGANAADPTKHNPQGGVLRAVNSNTGKTLWTAGGDGLFLAPASSVAVADLDNNGKPEIVALKYQGQGLVAFNADGSVAWDCTTLGTCFNTGSMFNWGGVAIADMNQDGSPEILYGTYLFKADGTPWPIANPAGSADNFVKPDALWHVGSLAVAVDLDNNDSSLEILGGRTIYTLDTESNQYVVDESRSTNIDAAIYITVDPYKDTQDGFPAAANFDSDNALEMVLVADEFVLLLDNDGSLLDSLHIPQDAAFGSFAGGPPTIADFDGDGQAEIGVAGERRYAVLDVNDGFLSVLWEREILETSSSRTGSSVFDFDADGRAEVVYNDEQYLRIYTFHGGNPPVGYSGCDAEMCTWERPNSSFTAYEYPVIADVNRDGNAEIIVAANDFGRTDPDDLTNGFVPTHGIAVFGDAADNWVPTRTIWNQHAYYITNINDDGSVPAHQTLLTTHNSFRKNIQGTADTPDLRAPDATCGDVIKRTKCPAAGAIGVWVENHGALQLPGGVSVTVYAGPPASGTVLGQGITRAVLNPGEAELVVIPIAAGGSGSRDAWVSVDSGMSGDSNNECREDNNVLNIGPLGC